MGRRSGRSERARPVANPAMVIGRSITPAHAARRRIIGQGRSKRVDKEPVAACPCGAVRERLW